MTSYDHTTLIVSCWCGWRQHQAYDGATTPSMAISHVCTLPDRFQELLDETGWTRVELERLHEQADHSAPGGLVVMPKRVAVFLSRLGLRYIDGDVNETTDHEGVRE